MNSPLYIEKAPPSVASSRTLPPADIGYTYSPENALPSVNPVIYSILVKKAPEVVPAPRKWREPEIEGKPMERMAGRLY